VTRSSSIWKLHPILVDGLIRVGSRIERAGVDYFVKHPVILPTDSAVVRLIIEGIHKKVGHMGRNSILAAHQESRAKMCHLSEISSSYAPTEDGQCAS
jgi:hypothetical protein